MMNKTTVKKFAPALLLLLAVLAWLTFSHGSDVQVNIGGDEFDGPLGALIGVAFAGGGLLIGAVVLVIVTMVLGLVFASLGVVLAGALALVAVLAALALSPLLLPLAMLMGMVWLVRRARRHRTVAA